MNRQNTEKLRQQYIQNPPEGMTADEIRSMSADDLLNMDYFLNEEDFDLGEEGEVCIPAFRRAVFIQKFSEKKTFL